MEQVNSTKTSLNDIQLAEIVELIVTVNALANRYSDEIPDSHKRAFEGLITSLEYFRFIDKDLRKKDPSFRKSTLKESIKANLLMFILQTKHSPKFDEAIQRIKEYIKEQKSNAVLCGSISNFSDL